MRVHHLIEGDDAATPLVLSNSLGTDTDMWRPQLAALRDRFRLVRYDHRGQGSSGVPPGPYEIEDLGRDAVELLDELGIERAHFCGISLGGMVCMWLAAHAPERVDRLVLCCTSAHMPPPEGWRERAETVRAAGTTEVIVDATLERWLTDEFRVREPATTAWLRAMVAASPAEGYASCCEAIGRMDLRPALAGIRAPTLVVAASEDPSTPPEHGQAMAAAISGARFELLGGAAHLASVEQPEAVTRLILEHLDTKEPTR